MNRFSLGVVISVLLIISINSYSLFETFQLSDKTGNLVQSGTASICINQAPNLIVNCNSAAIQNQAYACSLSATDPDNDTVTFSSVFNDELGFFNVTSWGYVSFTANQSQVGNHSINFSVNDGKGCSNSVDTETFDLEVINTNDAPKLVINIPDQTLSEQSSISFFLTTYFKDPDGDVMSFTKTIASNLNINIDGNGLVTITSTECDYTENVIFFAKDPYNETNESNIVAYTVNCVTTGDNTGDTNTGSSNSGGGGGGACIPELVCGTWEACQPDGTQRKKCADLQSCEDVTIKYLYRDCKYTAHCYNSILDFDEAGIDCGGNDCDSCPTCFDSILNQDETGIDCGGSVCKACEHCTNGVLDFDETGIDCGGAECVACPTCNDGIKNGRETDIDCGGDCSPCSEFQSPALIGETNFVPAIVTGILILLLALLLTFRYYKTWLKQNIARLFYIITGKTKKTILLTKEDADNLIRDLSVIMKENTTHKQLPQRLVFDLMNIGRKYFEKSFLVKQSVNIEDLQIAIDKKHISKELSSILLGFYSRIVTIEKGEVKIDKEEFEELAEELKEIIFMTSAFDLHKGIAVKREDLHKLKGKTKIYGYIHNSLFALEFGDLDEALRIYMQLLQAYDSLDIKHKSEVFKDVERLYKEILYAKKIN